MKNKEIDEFGFEVEEEVVETDLMSLPQKETSVPDVADPSQTGAPRKQIDLAKAGELARKGLNPGAIARLLLIDPRTLRKRMEDTPEVLEVIERGWAEKQEELIEQLDKHGKKGPIPTIFALKQPWLGGWADRPLGDFDGEVKYKVVTGILSPPEPKPPDAVEADFREVGEGKQTEREGP